MNMSQKILPVLALVSLFIFGSGCVNNQNQIIEKQRTQIDQLINRLSEQASTTNALEKKMSELGKISTVPIPVILEPQIKAKQPLAANRIKTQIVQFESYLDKYADIELACSIIGGYNYFLLHDDETAKAEAETNYSRYKKECFTYVGIRSETLGLVAEPELVIARKKMTDLIYTLSALGQYVLLDKGYSPVLENGLSLRSHRDLTSGVCDPLLGDNWNSFIKVDPITIDLTGPFDIVVE